MQINPPLILTNWVNIISCNSFCVSFIDWFILFDFCSFLILSKVLAFTFILFFSNKITNEFFKFTKHSVINLYI